MSFSRKVAFNTIVQFIGKSLGTVLGLFTVALMTRYLGTEGFGWYSTVITYLSFFGILIEFGLHITTLQLVGEKKYSEQKLLSNVFTLRLLSAVVAFSLAPIIVWAFPYSLAVKWGVVIATGSFICITLNQIMIAVLQLHLKMQVASFAEIAGRTMLFATVLLGVIQDWGFLYIMLAIVAGSFTQFIINFVIARKYITFQFAYDPKIWKIIITRSWPIGLSIFFNLLYLKSDILILSLTHTPADVGVYGATYRFLDVLTTIPAMFMGLILARLRERWVSGDLPGFQRIFQKAFDFLAILVMPMIAGTVMIADHIILIIAGAEFTASIPVLQIIIFTLGAIFLGGGFFGYTIIALNKQREVMMKYGLTAILSLSLYVWAIIHYSYYGAAWVTLFSEYFISVLLMMTVVRTIGYWPRLTVFFKSIFASLIMAGSIYFIRDMHVAIILLVAAGIYSVTLLAVRGVSITMIKEMLSS